MYAIIRCESGEYYTSTVFGYFCDSTEAAEYQQHIGSVRGQYYLVLNKEKNKIIKKHKYGTNGIHLETNVLIVDSSTLNWSINDRGQGCIDLLSNFTEYEIEYNLPSVTLKRLIKMDSAYQYNEYPTINCQKDIDDLMAVSGNFHDAHIEKIIESDNGYLYVLFKGVWGCQIEMWFSEDVSYCADSRIKGENEPWWLSSTMAIEDGFIYFVDDKNITISEINNNYCWFKSKKIRYHVIPNTLTER